MRLPFAPQPLAMLRMRYPRAIDHSHDAAGILPGDVAPPSTDLAHIFDFADGFRLIVSAEALRDGRRLLHLSASLDPSCAASADAKAGRLTPTDFLPMAEARFRALSGHDRPLDFLGFSTGKGVPHWKIDLTEGREPR